jgi:hypothetical protein
MISCRLVVVSGTAVLLFKFSDYNIKNIANVVHLNECAAGTNVVTQAAIRVPLEDAMAVTWRHVASSGQSGSAIKRAQLCQCINARKFNGTTEGLMTCHVTCQHDVTWLLLLLFA